MISIVRLVVFVFFLLLSYALFVVACAMVGDGALSGAMLVFASAASSSCVSLTVLSRGWV